MLHGNVEVSGLRPFLSPFLRAQRVVVLVGLRIHFWRSVHGILLPLIPGFCFRLRPALCEDLGPDEFSLPTLGPGSQTFSLFVLIFPRFSSFPCSIKCTVLPGWLCFPGPSPQGVFYGFCLCGVYPPPRALSVSRVCPARRFSAGFFTPGGITSQIVNRPCGD